MRDQFWRKYGLDDLDKQEWEALCDGCALCCLHKLEDDETGDVALTDIACRYLDMDSCVCKDYNNRHRNVPDCVPFNVETAKSFFWLPDTCAYRRLAQNESLPEWHYLESGDKNLVHSLAMSARDQSISEQLVHSDLWQERVVRWIDRPESEK